MSINLHLGATRRLRTESGKEVLQEESLDLYQTPSDITWDCLNKGTFEATLGAYLEWVESVVKPDDDTEPYYFTVSADDLDRFTVGGIDKDTVEFDRPLRVVNIIQRDSPEFAKLMEKEDHLAIFVSEETVSVAVLQEVPYRDAIQLRIQRYWEDEWDLKFYAL